MIQERFYRWTNENDIVGSRINDPESLLADWPPWLLLHTIKLLLEGFRYVFFAIIITVIFGLDRFLFCLSRYLKFTELIYDLKWTKVGNKHQTSHRNRLSIVQKINMWILKVFIPPEPPMRLVALLEVQFVASPPDQTACQHTRWADSSPPWHSPFQIHCRCTGILAGQIPSEISSTALHRETCCHRDAGSHHGVCFDCMTSRSENVGKICNFRCIATAELK